MKILLFGSSGVIGTPLVSELRKSHDVYTTSRSAVVLDSSDKHFAIDLLTITRSQLYQFIDSISPNVVVYLPAVHSSFDSALMNNNIISESMKTVNYVVPNWIADFCKQRTIYYVYISSSHLYSSPPGVIRYVDSSTLLTPISPYALSKYNHINYLRSLDYSNFLIPVLFNNISHLRKPPFLIPKLYEFTSNLISCSPSSNPTPLSLHSDNSIFSLTYALDTAYILSRLISINYTGTFVLGSPSIVCVSDIIRYLCQRVDINIFDYINFRVSNLESPSCVAPDSAFQSSLFPGYEFHSPENIFDLMSDYYRI